MQEYETSGSDGAGTAYPSGAPVFTPVLFLLPFAAVVHHLIRQG
jgi:hypothetical protein